jgi:hypothetical protein
MFEKVINNYRSQGFRLAIDDAGSGYNSLKTLVHLRPEFIKLDRSLIHNIVHNDAQQKMVSLLLNFGINRKHPLLPRVLNNIQICISYNKKAFILDRDSHLGNLTPQYLVLIEWQNYVKGEFRALLVFCLLPIPVQYESLLFKIMIYLGQMFVHFSTNHFLLLNDVPGFVLA